MNKTRILALADLIEKQPHVELNSDSGFNMREYHHRCGTPSCIAGWVNEMSKETNCGGPEHSAAKYLELDWVTADRLFEPSHLSGYHGGVFGWRDITPQQAATTLRKLAETGEVDWSHVS